MKTMYRIRFVIERVVDPTCLGKIMDEAHKWGDLKEALVSKFEDNSPVFGVSAELLAKHGWEQQPPLNP